MNIDKFLEIKRRMYEEECRLAKTKGEDYSGTENTLANLFMVERFGLYPAQVHVMGRVIDKLSRICRYLKTGKLKVEGEKITTEFNDVKNYLDLAFALLLEKGLLSSEDVPLPPPEQSS